MVTRGSTKPLASPGEVVIDGTYCQTQSARNLLVWTTCCGFLKYTKLPWGKQILPFQSWRTPEVATPGFRHRTDHTKNWGIVRYKARGTHPVCKPCQMWVIHRCADDDGQLRNHHP